MRVFSQIFENVKYFIVVLLESLPKLAVEVLNTGIRKVYMTSAVWIFPNPRGRVWGVLPLSFTVIFPYGEMAFVCTCSLMSAFYTRHSYFHLVPLDCCCVIATLFCGFGVGVRIYVMWSLFQRAFLFSWRVG
jgi:hypothetical protein